MIYIPTILVAIFVIACIALVAWHTHKAIQRHKIMNMKHETYCIGFLDITGELTEQDMIEIQERRDKALAYSMRETQPVEVETERQLNDSVLLRSNSEDKIL